MSNANSYELAMLDLINDEREAAGLEPLRLITTLNDAAETHSGWMLDTDMFSHTGASGSSPTDRMEVAGYPFEGNSLALENIGWQSLRGAEGIDDDVAQVHASLMNSEGHRDNILNPNAEDVGIGIETGTFTGQGGSYDAVMVTQVFGATDADISAWVDPGMGEDEDPLLIDEEDDQPVDEEPVEDDIVAEDDPMEEEPIEDEPVDDEPLDDETDEDMDEDSPDDEDMEDEDEGDETVDNGDPVDEPEVVEDEDAEDDSTDDEEDEDVVMDDDQPDDMPEDTPVCEMPIDGPPVLPFELSQFTVDLREAFEFTREGDQLIWETSEEKLIDVFLTAFEGWAKISPEEGDMTADEADLADLMIKDAPEAPFDMGVEDEPDEWMYDCGV